MTQANEPAHDPALQAAMNLLSQANRVTVRGLLALSELDGYHPAIPEVRFRFVKIAKLTYRGWLTGAQHKKLKGFTSAEEARTYVFEAHARLVRGTDQFRNAVLGLLAFQAEEAEARAEAEADRAGPLVCCLYDPGEAPRLMSEGVCASIEGAYVVHISECAEAEAGRSKPKTNR